MDSDVFLPVAMPTVAAGTNSGPLVTNAREALSASFVGRTEGGGKARFFVYGLNVWPKDENFGDFKVSPTDEPTIASVFTALNTLDPALVGNDGFNAHWYPYINTKFNDYYVRKLRG
jgi:hypothetical protein